ncbi:MAG TPA: lytic transglycosylase domain-containing protein [Bacteroidales bacterium]|nr:lytic transglycosylase domain-containing protein [Bacteroidales bacterium]
MKKPGIYILLKKRIPAIVVVMLGIIGAAAFIFAVSDKQTSESEYRHLFARSYQILLPEIPKEVSFADEEVPQDIFYVRESLDREILACTYMHSSTILMFKRAYRWFPLIEPILKKNGIPDDFKYIAVAESNFANVVSPSGAEGFWQFMKPTAQKYGLEVTDEVDERYHVEKATEAACRYFLDAYRNFGNWTLVAASYNRGMDGMSKALMNQKVQTYYDLFLNDETARYIYRIIASKLVYMHPVQYGFYLRASDFYPPIPTYVITIDSSISDLPQFALANRSNYRILRELNPWLKKYSLTNKTGKRYELVFPAEGFIHSDTLRKNLPVSKNFFHDTLRINQIR